MGFNDNQYDPLDTKPRSLSELKRDAEHAAFQRNHIKIKWERGSAGGRRSGKCVTCGRTVQIIQKPAANEIDIAGTAVALGCVGPGETEPPIDRKKFGQILRKEILAELEYLDALEACIKDLKDAARNGEPFKMYDTAKAIGSTLECYPESKVIKIDLQW